ncbi:MAG TPA: hypothetical protein VH540_28615 [Ktedonobacterales bacterium]
MTQAISSPMETTEAESAPTPLERRRTVLLAMLLFCFSLVILLLTSVKLHIDPFAPSGSNHFVYQAQSLLQGRLDIAPYVGAHNPPNNNTDIILVHGKHYIVYPPFPAILMMPLVAIFGLGLSDIFFTQVFSALNIALLFWLLELLRTSGRSRRTFQQNFALCVFFFIGTINFFLSLGGTMWFTAHIVATTCTLGCLLFAFKRRYVLSAICLGCAFLTRAPAIVGLPVLLYLFLEQETGAARLKEMIRALRARLPWRKLVVALVPLAVTLLLFLARNTLAFGNPLESGYTFLVQQKYTEVRYGVVGLHYIWPDFVVNFLSFPSFTFRDAFDISPQLNLMPNNGIGLSVFATTPLFLYLFFSRNRTPSPLRKALWVSVGLLVAAALLYHAAGWIQFGARYLFEGYVYAFLLLALSELEMGWRFYLLGVAGILINLLGAQAFWGSLPG